MDALSRDHIKLSEEITTLRAQLAAAEAELRDYKHGHAIASIGAMQEVSQEANEIAEKALLDLNAALAEIEALRTQLAESQRHEQRAADAVAVREGRIDTLRTQLAAAEAQLAGDTPHPDHHKTIASVDEIHHRHWEIGQLKKKLAAAEKRASTAEALVYAATREGPIALAMAERDTANARAARLGEALVTAKDVIRSGQPDIGIGVEWIDAALADTPHGCGDGGRKER